MHPNNLSVDDNIYAPDPKRGLYTLVRNLPATT